MKFRGVITEQKYMKDFLNLISTFSKLSRECVLKIEQQKISFIISEEMTQVTPFLYCDVQVDIFSQYTMSGVTEVHDKILLSLNPAYLASALSAVRNVVHLLKMKLTKKDFPCLTIEIHILPINCENTRILHHDVPVQVIKMEDWGEYDMPKIPDFKLTLCTMASKSIKSLIETLKNLAPYVVCCISAKGELSFVIEQDSATVACQYKDLGLVNTTHLINSNSNLEISCRVDLKKLFVFLASFQFSPTKVLYSISQDYVIKITVYLHEHILLNCLIPAINC